jgi:hypothetical protein
MCGPFAFLCCACSEGDNERLARVAHRAGDRIHAMSGGAFDRFSCGLSELRTRSGPDAALCDRVKSRLSLDKALSEGGIEVEAKAGVVTLRGNVPDAANRQRAVDLVQGTVGVEQVVDEMGPKE